MTPGFPPLSRNNPLPLDLHVPQTTAAAPIKPRLSSTPASVPACDTGLDNRPYRSPRNLNIHPSQQSPPLHSPSGPPIPPRHTLPPLHGRVRRSVSHSRAPQAPRVGIAQAFRRRRYRAKHRGHQTDAGRRLRRAGAQSSSRRAGRGSRVAGLDGRRRGGSCELRVVSRAGLWLSSPPRSEPESCAGFC